MASATPLLGALEVNSGRLAAAISLKFIRKLPDHRSQHALQLPELSARHVKLEAGSVQERDGGAGARQAGARRRGWAVRVKVAPLEKLACSALTRVLSKLYDFSNPMGTHFHMERFGQN